VEELERVLDLCVKYNVTVLLDVHAVRGSQNGLDNSGDSGHVRWFRGEREKEKETDKQSGTGKERETVLMYEHWRIRGGDWSGFYDETTQSFVSLNETNLLHTLEVVRRITLKYRNHPAVIGIQPGK
jgi:aryl-phospho-beta-D-glucosidase BglC (GH1 family)